jgi:RNA polymerase sigma-70 factor, ECF subfamily
VYRVAFNTAMAWSRTSKRQKARQVEAPDFDTIPAPLTPDTAQIDALYAAIRQLPAPDAALIMMYLEGTSYREMAEVMGLTESHVGAKLTRTRARLGQLMNRQRHE